MGTHQNNSQGPSMCARGCGFYGNHSTNFLCSKCYKEYLRECEDDIITTREYYDNEDLNSSSEIEYDDNDDEFAGNNIVLALPHPVEDCDIQRLKHSTQVDEKPKNRCMQCNKKVGLVAGFQCKCGSMFCGKHRYPEEHACNFDFKASGREKIVKDNPVIKASKLENKI